MDSTNNLIQEVLSKLNVQHVYMSANKTKQTIQLE